uniref:Dynein axonemal light chain 1 n=1 Tax=Peronospora matthiolae TaxID=2874970 RepID=A0AAV1TKW1_9STRA
MDTRHHRLEVRAALPLRLASPPTDSSIVLDDALDEDAYLKTLEETLRQHVARHEQPFLVLSATQVHLLAARLHDALVPRRDDSTHLIEAWTIQPQLQLKVKASAHIPVLKLSTILREVRRLRVHQPSQQLATEVVDEDEHRVPIQVEIFPSLKVVEALNTDVTELKHVHFFASQLRELHIEHANATALKQLLSPEREIPWRKLLKMHMNCCALERVDASVNFLRAVKILDLGWNKIDKFDAHVTTRSLEVLKLCHNRLTQVPPIQALRGLRELDLAVNRITSLKGIETLTALERLDFSHNFIDDITEMELLTGLSKLTYLKMEFNPIARRPDYRREVLFYLGEPIELDGNRWSDAEVSSMKHRRMLVMLDDASPHNAVGGKSWGQSQSVSVYPRAVIQSGNAVKNLKLVLEYPRLPPSCTVPAKFVDIQNPPSAFPTKSNQSQSGDGGETEGEDVGLWSPRNIPGAQDAGVLPRTVDDYLRTQRGAVVRTVEQGRNEHNMATEERDSVDFTSGRTRVPHFDYTASAFKRDFKEKELFARKDKDMDNVNLLSVRSTSRSRVSTSQKLGRSVSARVLLSAKEAVELGLHFNPEGVPANVMVKPQEVVEDLIVNDGNDPLTITRWLPNVAAIGTSILSSSMKIKLRSRVPSASTNAAYQFGSATSLEALLSPLVAYLFQQYNGCIVICNCANCRSLSLLTPEQRKAGDSPTVYTCLLCASCNVREVSFKKFVALCANEGITIPHTIPLTLPPWEATTEGFYIEEPPPADPAAGTSACECIMVCCNGIREVTAASAKSDTSDEVHSDEWNDVVVHAVTMAMR